MARIDRSGATTQMTTGKAIHLSLTGSETVCMTDHLS